MRPVRRWAGVVALCAAAAQISFVVMAGGASCCAPRAADSERGGDWCPAGSHAPGQCPLRHSIPKQSPPPDAPRLQCGLSSTVQFLMPVGVTPEPPVTISVPAQITAAADVLAAIPLDLRH